MTSSYNQVAGVDSGLNFPSPVRQALATSPEFKAGFLRFWQPNTQYAAGEIILNPSGQVISAKALFTSGASYVSTYFNDVPPNTNAVPISAVAGLQEYIQDTVAALLVAGSNITLTYDDNGNTLTIAAVNTTPSSISNTALPVISGNAAVGSTLSATTGSWSVTPDAYQYQWNRAGVAISNANSSTYVTTSADASKTLTVTVTVFKSGYTSGTATSGGFAVSAATSNALTTEAGDPLTTQAGDTIVVS